MTRLFQPIYRIFYPAKDPEEIKRVYGIPGNIDFQFSLRPDGWMELTSEQLPGLVTEGRNPQELLEMFNDAVLTYYDVPKREADIIFPVLNLSGIGTVTHRDAKVMKHA